MIQLFGFPTSNYYNKVKYVLLAKELEFEEVRIAPSQEDPNVLEKSPAGKIPFLKDEDLILSESTAIVEYLEEKYPAKPLLPKSPETRAKIRQIAQIIDLYCDLGARPAYGAAFFGGSATPELIDKCEKNVRLGFQALAKLVSYKPFLLSQELTLADIGFFVTVPLASSTMEKLGRPNPMELLPPGTTEYWQMLKELPLSKSISSAQRAALRMQAAAKREPK